MEETNNTTKHSSLKAEVVEIKLDKHPDADKLSVVKIDDFVCVTNTEGWNDKPLLACYIQPDTIVNTKLPEFSFLEKQANALGEYRIKARKIRGVNSFGLLIPAPVGAKTGDDLWDIYKLQHWNPPNPEDKETGFSVKDESGVTKLTISNKPLKVPVEIKNIRKYDLENGRKYARKYLVDGEEVLIFEKVHGQNSKYCSINGLQYAGGRTSWKNDRIDFSHITKDYLMAYMDEAKADEVLGRLKLSEEKGATNNWWSAFRDQPEIGKFCEANEGYILYGEVYGGKIQGGFNYGSITPRFIAFDIMTPKGEFMGPLEARELTKPFGIPWVPILYQGPFSVEKCSELAEGQTTFPAKHIREGVVVEPIIPRIDEKVGRIKFKFVGAGYLERS